MENKSHQDEKQKAGLGTTLVRSTAIENIADLASDIAETVLDSGIAEEAIKAIPVFGSLFKAYKAATSIRDLLFVKKIALFLEGVGDIPDEERRKFANRLDEDSEFCRDVGDRLILLLERHDDFDKSFMLGRVYAALVRASTSLR